MMLPGSSRCTLTFHCCMCGTWFVVNTPPVPPPMPRPRLVDAPSELARRQVEAFGERIVDRPERRAAVQADDHVALGVEADHAGRTGVARRLHVRRHVEDAPAGTNHGLLGQIPGQAETRAEVVVVGVHLPAVVVVHEHDLRLELRRIEERDSRARRPASGDGASAIEVASRSKRSVRGTSNS